MRRPETRSSRTALSGEISSRRRGLSPPCTSLKSCLILGPRRALTHYLNRRQRIGSPSL
jgi:hypothetical protein